MQSMYLLVTEDCNLQCKYCFEGDDKPRKYMTFETAKKAVDYLIQTDEDNENKRFGIVFFGGEPLMNFDLIKKVLEYTNSIEQSTDVKFWYSITTNGIIFNDEIYNLLKENDFSVLISIDGGKQSHDMNRITKNGAGSYDLVMKNLNFFVNKDEKFSANFAVRHTITKNNYHNLFKDVMSLRNIGFKNINFDPNFEDNWQEEDCITLKSEIEKVARSYYDIITLEDGIHITPFDKVIRKLVRPDEKAFCGAGKTNFAVSAEGDIYICSRLIDEKFRLGNVFEGINQKIADEFVYDSGNHSCSDCDYFGMCYKCLAVNIIHTGSMYDTFPM
ncbi:MAG: 4Fe-4S cluster-binding domain-containing protein [Desulfosporosinus sp.]|nr:4Fe-4S cluster-binding domain-containing protein [Desulfosporosinus sp.]